MIEAAMGFLGVLVGAGLSYVSESVHKRSSDRKALKYLAIQVSCVLEAFASRCADVALDDGSCGGQLLYDQAHEPTTVVPELDLQGINVRWETLAPELLQEILSLPVQIEESKKQVAAIFEHVAYPPEYEEGFQARMENHVRLGLQALSLTDQLRDAAKLSIAAQGTREIRAALSMADELVSERVKRQVENARSLTEAIEAAAQQGAQTDHASPNGLA